MKNILWMAGFGIFAFSCVYPAWASLEPTYEGYKQERKVRDDLLATQFEPDFKNHSQNNLFELHMFPGWFKPLCDERQYKGSSRLVVKLSNGTASLNPVGELEYPPDAIDLHELSLENAKMLWGEPKGQTFDLLSRTRDAEMDVFHLDTKFVNGRLQSYRLRGIGISKPEWLSVE